MWDRHNSMYFTKVEALAIVGKLVLLNSGDTMRIVDTFCEGPDQYALVTEPWKGHPGYIVNQSDNNGLYVSEILPD